MPEQNATVILLQCTEEEERFLSELAGSSGIPLNIETWDDASQIALRDFLDLRLVVFRVREDETRPEMSVRRLRDILNRGVPLLVLLPKEKTRWVPVLLRSGASDYWILPLDRHAFPERFRLLLEWDEGETRGAGEILPRRQEKDTLSGWGGIAGWIRRMLKKSLPGRERKSVDASRFLDRWEKIRRLGFGSFGEVWLVQEKNGENVAVAKVPHEEKLNRKFLMEAAILRRLSGHPNAVALLEVIKVGGKVVLIQEYVSGHTLQELLDMGIEGPEKEKLYLQLLDVVAYAHKHHVMHRDIKPENIIVTPSGKLKLLDFGTAKDVTGCSVSSTVIGSRPFMAPEQIMGRSRLASDVWALGVILYTLATECLPFYSDNEKELMDLILEAPPESPRDLEPDLDPKLEGIILRCLEKEWERRFSTADELRRALLDAFPRFGSGGVLP